MALIGSAFLALFNDFDPARDGEYNEWHSREHVPERLTIPGITRARRYVGRAELRFTYFTLYEVASADTLLSQAYQHLLANPTPWSGTMRPSFRQFLRIPCRTIVSCGDGIAGHVGVFVLQAAQAPDATQWQQLCEQLTALPGFVGAHAGEQDVNLPGPAVSAAQALAALPTFVVVVEAQEQRCLSTQAGEVDRLLRALPGVERVATHEYALMHLVTEGRAPATTRPS
jgi:hypothetical protein